MANFIIFFLIFFLVTVFIFLFVYLRKNRQQISNYLAQAQSNHTASFNSIFSQLSGLYEKMGGLDRESKEIHSLTKEFQNILIPTKKRGIAGESLAENLLRDVLPDGVLLTQHSFKDGKKVDFAIKLPAGLVPVDAKFSLEVFANWQQAESFQEKQKKKILIDSIKKQICQAAGYIYPDQGTVDFSLMYLPSEAIYSFVTGENGLTDFARQKKVFITGPNTLYAYLNTLCIGFKALNIEKSTRQVYNALERLEKDLAAFNKDYQVLGNHLRLANLKYQELSQKIEGLSFQLAAIEKEKE